MLEKKAKKSLPMCRGCSDLQNKISVRAALINAVTQKKCCFFPIAVSLSHMVPIFSSDQCNTVFNLTILVFFLLYSTQSYLNQPPEQPQSMQNWITPWKKKRVRTEIHGIRNLKKSSTIYLRSFFSCNPATGKTFFSRTTSKAPPRLFFFTQTLQNMNYV